MRVSNLRFQGFTQDSFKEANPSRKLEMTCCRRYSFNWFLIRSDQYFKFFSLNFLSCLLICLSPIFMFKTFMKFFCKLLDQDLSFVIFLQFDNVSNVLTFTWLSFREESNISFFRPFGNLGHLGIGISIGFGTRIQKLFFVLYKSIYSAKLVIYILVKDNILSKYTAYNQLTFT